jgi:hypothetical protein
MAQNGTRKWTISHGNLVDGFELYGIFDTENDAIEWADQDAHLSDNWNVIAIELEERP